MSISATMITAGACLPFADVEFHFASTIEGAPDVLAAE